MILKAHNDYRKSRGHVHDVATGTAVLTWTLDTFPSTSATADYRFVDLERESIQPYISIEVIANLRDAIVKHRNHTGRSEVIPWLVLIPNSTARPQTIVLLPTLLATSAKPGWHPAISWIYCGSF